MSTPVAAAAGALKGWRSESPSRHAPHSRLAVPPLRPPGHASGAGHQRFPGLRQGHQPRWHWHLGWDSRAGPPRSSGALIWGPTPLHPM